MRTNRPGLARCSQCNCHAARRHRPPFASFSLFATACQGRTRLPHGVDAKAPPTRPEVREALRLLAQPGLYYFVWLALIVSGHRQQRGHPSWQSVDRFFLHLGELTPGAARILQSTLAVTGLKDTARDGQIYSSLSG